MWTKRSGERGASAVEYGLILTFVALAIVISVVVFGEAVRQLFLADWPW